MTKSTSLYVLTSFKNERLSVVKRTPPLNGRSLTPMSLSCDLVTSILSLLVISMPSTLSSSLLKPVKQCFVTPSKETISSVRALISSSICFLFSCVISASESSLTRSLKKGRYSLISYPFKASRYADFTKSWLSFL